MTGNDKLKLRAVLLASMVGMGLSLAACDRKDEPPMERASDSIQDGLNMRDNEQMKDAGEDVKSAVENAGDAVEQQADDMTQ